MPETLVCIPGRRYVDARYSADGRGTTPRLATPMAALVDLYKPASLVALCTPEALETIKAYKEWAEARPLMPQPELVVIDIKLAPGPDGIAALLGQVAAIEPPSRDVHLDLTFGPRSATILAMLSSLVQLAAGRWNISRLTYVNNDARPGGRNSTEPVPIEDLTSYLALPALATAVANLKARGDIAGFARALRNLPGTDTKALRDEDLTALEEAITYLRIMPLMNTGVGGALGRLRKAMAALKASPGAGLAGPLIDDAENVLEGLRAPAGTRPGSPAHLGVLVRWYRAHAQPDRALLLASEALAAMTCEVILKRKPYPMADESAHGRRSWPARRYFEEAQEVPLSARGRRLAESGYTLWESLHRTRSEYAHASFTSKPGKSVVQAEEVTKLLDEFEQLAIAFQALL